MYQSVILIQDRDNSNKISNEELIAFANGDIDLKFPFIKCHNVDIERAVKHTTIASSKGRNHDEIQSYILHTRERLEKVPTDFNKRHFKDY